MIEHTRVVAAATTLPVSVDLENGHGPPGEAIARAAEAGAAGGSIEDYDLETDRVYALEEAVERVTAAVEAARAAAGDFVLTAARRTTSTSNPDLDDTIARLLAFEAAGADVLYAPGCAAPTRSARSARGLQARQRARPRGLCCAEVVEAGAQRVSVGGALTWVAAAALKDAAERMRDGDFSVLAARARGPEGF